MCTTDKTHNKIFGNHMVIKYFLYARKSSESEDRQVQSIGDQIRLLKELSKRSNLKIVHIFEESKSAKQPDNRPLFQEMMGRLKKGEANGILCWQINRLSRNSIDSGLIQWLLQEGTIQSIQTFDREYRPDDNALLFSVESGMANQYIIDLRKNVKRGMQSKLDKGHYPHMPPLGYLNDKETKDIKVDPDRFPLIRKMWDLMLTGTYSTRDILNLSNKKWGLRTRKFKRSGGREVCLSTIYKTLTNIFYTGKMEVKGVLYEGKHQPMVTIDEFDRVQMLLGRKGKPRQRTHEFAFTGIIRCGECGCLVTAETKRKLLKNGQINYYTYYHCTWRRKDFDCSQHKVIREEDLEEQIKQELSKITILPEFKDWALEIIKREHDNEVDKRTGIYKNQQKTVNDIQKELDNLLQMKIKDLITDDEYSKTKASLNEKMSSIKEGLELTEKRAENWQSVIEKSAAFYTHAYQVFIEGDLKTKRGILQALGNTFTIKDGKLSLMMNEWLLPIKEEYPQIEKEYLELKRLEPTKNMTATTKILCPKTISVKWLRTFDDIRTYFKSLTEPFFLPEKILTPKA